jgi:hypothetical protein
MPTAKLDATFVAIADCPPGKKKIDYYDTHVTGFILEVRPSGMKTYYLRYRDPHGDQRQFKIGGFTDLTVDKARKKAQEIRARAVVGENPTEERKLKRQVPTVEELSLRYMAHVRSYKRSAASMSAIWPTTSFRGLGGCGSIRCCRRMSSRGSMRR